MLTSESITTIMPAFIKAQANFAPAVKSATNPHFKSKYVALDGVIDAVAAPLREQGIAIMQMTDIEDARTILVTRLIHSSGEWLGSRYPVHPVKADPQGEGSALTYARRYALMALVGIAPEDDDGNAAVKASEKAASAPITEEQEATLRDTLEAQGKDVNACCAYFGVSMLSELPAAKYAAAIKIAATPKPVKAA
jgi:hypothetical protein